MTYNIDVHQSRRAARRAALARKMGGYLAQALFVALAGLTVALVLINWIMGCGEVFYLADGSTVMGECLSVGDLL